MRYAAAIVVGRLARLAIRRVRPGGGSALPGLIVSKLAPGLLAKTLRSFPGGLVVITGSAGKSTTTKMVVGILRAHGLEVFTNPSTANIEQGFFSAILERSNVFGRIDGDVAVLEMDEGHAAAITKRISPDHVCILNVLEDQLDRFIDPANVREKLTEVAGRATKSLVLNADDQNILLLSEAIGSTSAKKDFFSIESKVVAKTAHGLGYAPTYLPTLSSPAASAVVTDVIKQECAISIGGEKVIVKLPNRGLHFALDAVAALQTSSSYMGEGFDLNLAVQTLNSLPPVFARGEIGEVQGQKIEFILVQNPMSFQLNLDNLIGQPERLMVAIGRDVHDPSWLWTVDFSGINRVDIVTGYNAAEMALRLAYEEIELDLLSDDLEVAMDAFLALPTPVSGVKTVMFSADAMRRLRRMLGFTSPEEVER